MKPEDVEVLLERLAAPAAPERMRERFLAEASRRLAVPAGAARVSRGGWLLVAASLLVALAVMWAGVSPVLVPARATEDPLPPGAILRLGTARFRHPTLIHAIAVSPDGKTLASAGSGRSPLRLWETATGRPLQEPGNLLPDGADPRALAQKVGQRIHGREHLTSPRRAVFNPGALRN